MGADETTPAERDRTVGEIVEERLLAIEEKLGLGQFSGKSKPKSGAKAKGGGDKGGGSDDAGADKKEA